MLTEADISWRHLRDRGDRNPAALPLGAMHLAKGLEFKAVLLLDCAASVIPDPSALKDAEPEEQDAILERERQLLYVAMTRARDELVVGWSGRPSPFLEPLLKATRG
jgi:superfamily I DNA/RNA helicase